MLGKFCFSLIAFLSFTVPAAAQVCSAADILKPDQVHYDQNIVTFLAYSNMVDQLVKQNQSQGLGAQYEGFGVDYNDAQSIAAFFSSRTNYVLSQDASISVVSSVIPADARQTFLECIRATRSNVEILTKPGAQFQEAFQGQILWHPTYSVEIKPNDRDERGVRLVATNGSVVFGDGEKVRPQQDSPFSISRPNLDKPFYLTAFIDKKASEQLEFPARPQNTVRTELREYQSEQFRRGGIHTDASDWGPYCVKPQKGGVLLPSTAEVTKTGSGPDWDNKSKVRISSKSPQSVCIVVHADSVGSPEGQYEYYVQATLSVAEAYIEKIEY